MGDEKHHSRLAKEKRDGALAEFREGRYTVVGDLAVKAVEQAIEALASREGLYFHLRPRTAHAERTGRAKESFTPVTQVHELDVGY
ncbi:MAG: hypothetical protein RMK31_05535, partial [Candidatus Caldarchaeum sp.]|nr:hypothetical protein [Candidatus Caldarchaeum sp.]